MTTKEIVKKLKSLSDPKNIEDMKRFAVGGKNTLGISMPVLRQIAQDLGKNHQLARELWASEIHEARILASLVDEVKLVNEKQMDSWVKDFDSWDVCDQVCMNLFDKTEFAFNKAIEWASRMEEFQKRAGFALMACLAWHQKEGKEIDKKLKKFFPIILRESTDERNFVRKAVNWALRQIGKRNAALCAQALQTAREILKKYPNNKTAHWITQDVIRELKDKSSKNLFKFRN